MARLSISNAWKETATILQAESRVLLPLALALLVLPQVVSTVIAPVKSAGNMPTPGAWMYLALPVLILRLFGVLAITRVALGPAERVGTALRDVGRRLPAMLGLGLIVLVPVSLIGGLLLVPMLKTPSNPPPGPALGMLVLVGVSLFLLIRLSLAPAVAVRGGRNPWSIARESFALTRGAFWRIAAAVLMWMVTFWLLGLVTQSVLGSVVILLTGRVQAMSVSLLILALVAAAIDAAGVVGLTVLLARIYSQRRVAPGVPISGT